MALVACWVLALVAVAFSIPDNSRKDQKLSSQWKPGQSGNPTGRPKGSGPFAALRENIGTHMPEIINVLAAQAKGGDVAAARLLMERIYPAIKPVELAQPIAIADGSLTDKGRAVLAAVGAGELAPSQGAALVAAIGALARVVEIDDLAARIEALEASHAKS